MKKPNLMFPVLIFFFFLSGACGLMYEIIWQRMLLLIFGISNFAVATVLSSFMAGLALGSYFFGKKADTIKRPLRLYAFLEIGIALFAFIFPSILDLITSLYTAVHHQFHTTWYLMNLLKFLLCFVVLLIPATLMGGTLPVAVRYIVKSLKHVGNRVGSLYGINTLGAVVGCIAAGFFMIALYGAKETGYIAAVINLTIGLLILLLDSRLSSAPVESLPEKEDTIQQSLKPYPPAVATVILIVAGVSGFCALAFEVLWTRTITFYLQASIYAFPTMLATFLCGSAIGTLLIIKFADKQKSAPMLIGILQLLIGIAAILTLWEFGSIRLLIAKLWATSSRDWFSFLANGFVASSIIMFIPTLFMGMIIPLAAKVYAQTLNNIGGNIGRIYAINTAGAVVGSFITGFVLIPLIGVTKAIFAISAVNIAAGAVVLLLKFSPWKIFRYCVIAASLIFIIGAGIMIIPAKTPLFFNSPYFMNLEAGEKILYYDEGPGATITVRRLSPYVFDNKRYDLIEVNAANVAGTAPGLRVTQKIQGHFPLILYKATTGMDTRFAFILGLGTGESSHCICLHDIEKLDCLELVPGEIKANAQFNDINHKILENKKFQLTINDARNFLMTATKHYDVLESDAVHPEIDIGTYTKEYFEICKARLSEQGIFSSWIP
ncbi:MAG: fused MFS/spermidine synthase, partial [Deltaproteobacteria bacterium]|nr:fused MFS/spermidine synthase [Deltaproteobacteria bacterium]